MLWVLVAAIGLAGLVLVVVGLRGRRVDDHPVCRRCRFDLIGVYPRIERCPECGGELGGPGAVRVGNRRRRVFPLAAGAVLLLLGLGGAGGFAWAAATGYDWNRVKPTGLLIRETRGLDEARRDRALAKLQRRIEEVAFAESHARKLIDSLLEIQRASEPLPLGGPLPRQAWAETFAAAHAKGFVLRDELVQYVKQGLSITAAARSRAAAGQDKILMLLVTGDRLGEDVGLGFHVDFVGATLGGEPIKLAEETLAELMTSAPRRGFAVASRVIRTSPRRHGKVPDLPPGRHELCMTWRITLFERIQPGQTPLGDPGETVAEWEVADTRPVTVVAPGEPIVRVVSDPELREAMRDAIRIEAFHDSMGGEPGWRLRGSVRLDNPPVPVAFDAVVKTDEHQWRAGPIHWPMELTPTGAIALTVHDADNLTAESVDVLLRPLPHHALSNTLLDEIWGEQILIRNVPVRRRPGHSNQPASRPSDR